jgi:hypothetical protein
MIYCIESVHKSVKKGLIPLKGVKVTNADTVYTLNGSNDCIDFVVTFLKIVFCFRYYILFVIPYIFVDFNERILIKCRTKHYLNLLHLEN